MKKEKSTRELALKWWRDLPSITGKYELAKKYYPNDIFAMTDMSSSRIERIYLKENER